MYASRTELFGGLKDGARGSSNRRARNFRSVLIVGEVALSVVLLVGSALLLLSFIRLQRTPPGFDPKGAAAAFVGIPVVRYDTPVRQAQFYSDVVDHLLAEPKVTNAAVGLALPLSGLIPRSPYSVNGRAILPLPQRPLANLEVVSEGYFGLMRIPMLEGRGFEATDRTGSPAVCVINESFAKRLFPGESAVGKVLLRGAAADVRVEIVGVIGDVKTNGLNAPPPDEIYFPVRQLALPGMTIIARTSGDTAALQTVIRSAVTAVDKDQPITRFASLETTVAQSVGSQRLVSWLTAIFAGVALALSAVGLYSVVAYVVSQRTSEIGIRMALGAEPGQVIRLVMRGGLTLVGIGLGLGLAGAAGAVRLIQSLLFEVQPLDLFVYGSVALLFIVVGCLACLAPSLRAARIDPLLALRSD
jgi:putative ABC transport system permease protein